MAVAVTIRFVAPIAFDEVRAEHVLKHHFGATDIEIGLEEASFSAQVGQRKPLWEPREGTGAAALLSLARERGIFRWRDFKHIRNARAALELLLMDGHLEKVRHGVFKIGGAPDDLERRVKLEPHNRQLGPRQQQIFDALDKPKTAPELRDLAGVSRQAVDQLLKKLIKQGLIRRLSTVGEQAEWLYIQSDRRTADVLVARQPALSSIEVSILSLLPPSGSVALVQLRDNVPAYHPPLKRLQAKGLVELIGTPKRRLLRLTRRGLEHPSYDIGATHLAGRSEDEVYQPEMMRLMIALDALGEARALDLTDVAKIRRKRKAGTGQYLQRLQMAGCVDQFRPIKNRAPHYRLTKKGATAVAAAKVVGRGIKPVLAQKRLKAARDERSHRARERSLASVNSRLAGGGRTWEILALLSDAQGLTGAELQRMLSVPYKHLRSADLALCDLGKRGWVVAEEGIPKSRTHWRISPDGKEWLVRHWAVTGAEATRSTTASESS